MRHLALAAVLAVSLVSTTALAGDKTYQVTGPVTDLTDSTITVEKGKEKWTVNKGTATVPADVKVGSKVTVEYSMTAATITSKDAKKADKAEKKDEKKDAAAPAKEEKKEEKKDDKKKK